MKKIISILLLIIISIQCLPVKELGKCFFDSSFIEEDISHKSLEKKEVKDLCKEFFTINTEEDSLILQGNFYAVETAEIYVAPFADLNIQPPNKC
ncbi:MAG: hypothetical protein ACKVOM_11015 [Ferruginibacter sp.]